MDESDGSSLRSLAENGDISMQSEVENRVLLGTCPKCAQNIRVKPQGLAREMRLTCKCGTVNTFRVADDVLLKHGRIRPVDTHDPYREKSTSLYTLLGRPDAAVSINPYVDERNARAALAVIIERLTSQKTVRPFSVELIENVELAIEGLLQAPFFILLGVTGYNALQEIVHGLRSDCPTIGAGAEWEIWSGRQGDYWRGSNWARLRERWVFLEGDVCHKL